MACAYHQEDEWVRHVWEKAEEELQSELESDPTPKKEQPDIVPTDSESGPTPVPAPDGVPALSTEPSSTQPMLQSQPQPEQAPVTPATTVPAVATAPASAAVKTRKGKQTGRAGCCAANRPVVSKFNPQN